jgi:D-alanyl-D-alanine carboxypeptidase
VIALAAGGAAAALVMTRPKHETATRAAPPPTRTAVHRRSRKHVQPRPLVFGRPESHRRLRSPLRARAAIVVDGDTGRVLWALDPHRRLPIASTTKIMTAVVALERVSPDALVTIPPSVLRVPLVKEGLRARERVRAWKLFDGLLIYSGNDDALALAIEAAGTRRAFIARMNEKAAELGLRDTHFSTPSGVIDADNYSSAWDLAALTRFALRNREFRHIVRTRLARVPWSPPTYEKVYVNKNPLLGTYRGANGVKTGWTTLAGHCLVASATRDGRTIIVVLLHDANAYVDSTRLLNLGFATRA